MNSPPNEAQLAAIAAEVESEVSPHRWRSYGRSPYLYVIVIAFNRIKVGVTVSPELRLREHRGLAQAFGAESGRQWVSYPGVGTPENEAALVAFCAEHAGRQFRREYFSGLAFEDVVEYAEILSGNDPRRRGRINRPPGEFVRPSNRRGAFNQQ